MTLGTASWSKPGAEDRAIKCGCPDKNGKTARGGLDPARLASLRFVILDQRELRKCPVERATIRRTLYHLHARMSRR